jgi:hypothetical protein
MTPTAELLYPARLNLGGVVFEKGIVKPVDFDLACTLNESPRFKVRGLNSREAIEHLKKEGRPVGEALTIAIREAADSLDEDDANYDRNGKPSHHAISTVLGYPITVNERDKALGLTMKAAPAGRLETADGNTEQPVRKGSLTVTTRTSAEQKEAILKAAKAKDATAGKGPVADPAEPEHDPSTEGAVAS